MILFDAFFGRGCPRIVDWKGRNADAIGIEPVYPQ
jgi:hypothetical protein